MSLLGPNGKPVAAPLRVQATVCTSLHDNRVHFQYLAGMLSCVAKYGPQQVMLIARSGSFLPRLRDLLTTDFLKSGARFMLFVDSDQGWTVKNLEALMAHDVDVVSGLVSRKDINSRTMPAKWSGERMRTDAGATLYGADYCGAGFLLLKREAVLKMVESYSELAYPADGVDLKNGVTFALWAPSMFPQAKGVSCLGEDYSFCHRWTRLGGKIWVDPACVIHHLGEFDYVPTGPQGYEEKEETAYEEAAPVDEDAGKGSE